MNTIADELATHRFFAKIEPEHLEVVGGCGRNAVVPAGTTIIREGAQADEFWALRSGRVALGVVTPGRGLLTIENSSCRRRAGLGVALPAVPLALRCRGPR